MVNLFKKQPFLGFILLLGIIWTVAYVGIVFWPPGFLQMWFMESSKAVAVAADGNVYVGGRFSGVGDFDPSSGVDRHECNGTSDIFLSKFDSNGNLIWVRTWGGNIYSDTYDVIDDIATDSMGSVYITGVFFASTVDFDPGPGVDENTLLTDSLDIFLSKFDSSGNYIWSRTWGGEGWDDSYALSIYIGDIISVACDLSDTVDFDPGPDVVKRQTGNHESYCSRFDSSGNFLGVEESERPVSDSRYTSKAAGDGNTYVLGNFNTERIFPFGAQELTFNGGWDIFLAKLDPTHKVIWVRTWGGKSWDYGQGLAIDGNGNVYVTGSFCGKVDFDPGPGVDKHRSRGYNDIFLSKFDPSGNFIWARTWGGQNRSTPF
jgi:hypothetical protein